MNMTLEQRLTVCRLQRDGYRINYEGEKVCMSRGNDYRTIGPDGVMRRALGAKK